MTDTAQITIRAATPADAAEATRLFGALHKYNAALDPCFALADHWEDLVEQYIQQSQHSDERLWLLGYANDQAVGFVLAEVHTDVPLHKHRRWAEIVGLYVDDEHRGGEVADRLMAQTYAWAAQHQLHSIQLYVTATNTRAQHFYARHGFHTTQQIMRRTIETTATDDHAAVPATARLHFREGGTRPF